MKFVILMYLQKLLSFKYPYLSRAKKKETLIGFVKFWIEHSTVILNPFTPSAFTNTLTFVALGSKFAITSLISAASKLAVVESANSNNNFLTFPPISG